MIQDRDVWQRCLAALAMCKTSSACACSVVEVQKLLISPASKSFSKAKWIWTAIVIWGPSILTPHSRIQAAQQVYAWFIEATGTCRIFICHLVCWFPSSDFSNFTTTFDFRNDYHGSVLEVRKLGPISGVSLQLSQTIQRCMPKQPLQPRSN